MNLTTLIPGPSLLYRFAAYAALAASLVGFGWFKGSEHWHGKLIEAQAAALKEGSRITIVRGAVTTQIETKYVPQIARAQVVTETIIKEVPIYVQASDPPLSGGFRVLHDAAATGSIPDPARIADAAGVPAQDAARIVTENYGACRQAIIELDGLQEWVRGQQAVK